MAAEADDNLSDDDRAQIHAHIFAHRKIQAIKIYRQATRQGLKEAKDAVEAMTAELQETSAERFAPRGKGGCLPMIVLAIAAGVVAAVAIKVIT